MARIFGERPLTVYRKAECTEAEGVVSPGAESTLTIKGAVQPLTLREVQFLPEGWRNQARYWMATRTKLQTLSTESVLMPDEIELDGVRYQVQAHGDWSQAGGSPATRHHEYYLLAPEVT